MSRFEGLRTVLPAASRVGYLTDRHDVWEWRILTQYALTPVIVEDRVDLPLVVGNFHAPGYVLAGRHVYRDLSVLKDFGNGVVLLVRPK